jgi:hypothetical protein
MNPILFCTLALGAAFFISACASHAPAPTPAGALEVHTY